MNTLQQRRGLQYRQLHLAVSHDGCHDHCTRAITGWVHVRFIVALLFLVSLILRRLWNYNPYNDDQRGDDWNGENFSWFSRKRALPPSLLYYEQDAPSLDNGGRILSAVVRPYPAKTAGIPLSFEYEMNDGTFTFEWEGRSTGAGTPSEKSVTNPPRRLQTPLKSRETEIFVPSQLTHARKVMVQGLKEGDRWTYDEKRQTLFVVTKDNDAGHKHRIIVSVDPPPRPSFAVNDFWGDFGGRISALVFLLASILAYWILQ